MTLSEAETKLKFCTSRLAEASSAARTASSLETQAINDLNEAQREFDGIVIEMRKASPRGSAWADMQRQRLPAG